MALMSQQNSKKASFESSDTSPLNLPYTLQIPGVEDIYLFPHKNVWPAYSAAYFLSEVIKSGKIDFTEIFEMVDVGSGSGALAIALSKLGVKHVYMTDINTDALQLMPVTAQQNFLRRGRDYDVLYSNALDELINEGIKVDLIISNVPMNPEMPGIHEDDLAAKSNQNPDGRKVFDDIVATSSEVLNPGGYVVLTFSSRQGEYLNEERLEQYYPGSWEIINRDPVDGMPGINEKLVDYYHGPFLMHWKGQTKDDNMLRVYKLDEFGLPYYEEVIPSRDTSPENRKIRKIFTKIENGKFVYYMAIINGRPENIKVFPFKPYETEPEELVGFPLNQIPNAHPTDTSYYQRYYVGIMRKAFPGKAKLMEG